MKTTKIIISSEHHNPLDVCKHSQLVILRKLRNGKVQYTYKGAQLHLLKEGKIELAYNDIEAMGSMSAKRIAMLIGRYNRYVDIKNEHSGKVI